MTKIYIDAGHGGSDPGAVANGLREKDLTLAISKRIAERLKDYKCDVRLSRTGDATLSLKQRTDDANRWGADFLLSIHINAGGGTGYEDFVYSRVANGSRTARLRDAIHGEVTKELKEWRNRGKKSANFHMLRESKMPAMLSESGFIDTKADADKLRSNAFIDRIAKGHANGLIKALGLVKKDGKANASTTPKKPAKDVKTTNKKAKASKSVSQMASEVIAGKHGNGHAARRKSLGVSASVYAKVRAEVNRRANGGKATTAKKAKARKSVSQMATEVIAGKHGRGHVNRRRSLGVDAATYAKVRAEVNRRMK